MSSSKIKIGDRVRVEKTPKMDSSWPAETARIFRRVVGHSFQVRGFNEVGFAEIWARVDGSPARTCCCHSLWIETDCIKLVKKKKKK